MYFNKNKKQVKIFFGIDIKILELEHIFIKIQCLLIQIIKAK